MHDNMHLSEVYYKLFSFKQSCVKIFQVTWPMHINIKNKKISKPDFALRHIYSACRRALLATSHLVKHMKRQSLNEKNKIFSNELTAKTNMMHV